MINSDNPYIGHVHILFLCNGTKCGENHDCGNCKHTTNALYAKNFELSMINHDGQNTEYYFTEKENPSEKENPLISNYECYNCGEVFSTSSSNPTCPSCGSKDVYKEVNNATSEN